MAAESEKDTLEKDIKIAALGGAGLPLSMVAREAGVTTSQARYTLETKVEKNTHGLGDVYDQFREEMRPVIQDIVRVALTKLASKVQGHRVEIRDLVAVYNILSVHAGLGESTSEIQTQRRTAVIDTRNPAVVKALREALVTERSEQTKALVSGDKT